MNDIFTYIHIHRCARSQTEGVSRFKFVETESWWWRERNRGFLFDAVYRKQANNPFLCLCLSVCVSTCISSSLPFSPRRLIFLFYVALVLFSRLCSLFLKLNQTNKQQNKSIENFSMTCSKPTRIRLSLSLSVRGVHLSSAQGLLFNRFRWHHRLTCIHRYFGSLGDMRTEMCVWLDSLGTKSKACIITYRTDGCESMFTRVPVIVMRSFFSVSASRYRSVEHQVSSDWLQWIARRTTVLVRNRTVRENRCESKRRPRSIVLSTLRDDRRLGQYLPNQRSRNQCASGQGQSRDHWWMASSDEILGQIALVEGNHARGFDRIWTTDRSLLGWLW